MTIATPRPDGARGVPPPRRVRSDDRSRFDQSMLPQSRSPFPLLSLTASAYVEMNRALVLAAILALAMSGCSQAQPAPTPAGGCPEPTRTVFGQSPFDVDNLATWRKE